MAIMARTSEFGAAKVTLVLTVSLTTVYHSTNDVLLLEIDAGGTQFAAGTDNQDAFATLIDGDQWMIYRNVLTNVLHWDFVSYNRHVTVPTILMLPRAERVGSFHQFPGH